MDGVLKCCEMSTVFLIYGNFKCFHEIMTQPQKKCMAASAPLKYTVYTQFMAASALLKKNVSRPQLLLRNKETL